MQNKEADSLNGAGYGSHFQEGNPNDYYCTCFSANLRAISIHAEVFLKRNYGGCCKRLTLIIPGIRSL